MTQWDAPNQQVVRADHSAPWDEGTGGADAGAGTFAAGTQAAAEDAPKLDTLTKDELLDVAAERGVDADSSMTKAEIRQALGEE